MIVETIINYQDCFIWAYKGQALQAGTMEQIMCSGYLHKLILAMGVCAPLLAVLL